MRLLSKKEINTQVAEHRRVEIQEGTKLAKRVDSLRQKYVDEKDKYEKYVTETQKILQDQLKKLEEKRSSIQKEVTYLEAKQVKLRIPLDAEWEALRSQQEGLQEWSDKLKNDQANLDALKIHIADLEKIAIEREKRAKLYEEDAQKQVKSAIISIQQAEQQKKEALQLLESVTAHENRTKTSLQERERSLDDRETAIKSVEKAQNDEKIRLRDLEIFLEDERRTLERAFNRLNTPNGKRSTR